MASYADSFGFTPTDFFSLTLAQLNAFSRYIENRDKEMKKASKSKSSGNAGGKSIDSVEQLVATFGKPGFAGNS
jgi:hypothetical protein